MMFKNVFWIRTLFPPFLRTRLKVVKEKCPMEFSAFSGCLDRYNTRYEDCRKTQKKFMACWTKEPVTEEKEE